MIDSNGISNVFEKIAIWAFYLMVLFVPLAYFPWTIDALEVNKQTVTIILTAVSVIAWLGMMVARKRFYFKKTFVFILPAVLLVSLLISSILSLAPYTSWFGQGTQEYVSFFSMLTFVLIFIVGAHFLSETRVQKVVWALSILASTIIGLSITSAMLGFVIFPTNFLGTSNSLGLYLAVMTIVGCGLWLVDGGSGKKVLLKGTFGVLEKLGIIVTSIAGMIVLLALDFWMLWVAAIIGVGIMFVFALIRAQEFPQTSKFVLPMILFVISLLFLFIPSFIGGKLGVEISPSYQSSFSIATQTLSDSSVLFGSGPGTFSIDYSKFAPLDINATDIWDIRFDRSGSHAMTLFATYGFVGIFVLLVLLLSIGLLALKQLLIEKEHDEWKMTFVTFSGWLVLVFGFFFYSSNFTLSFLLWLFSAILISQVGPSIKQWEFKQSPRFGLLTAFLFVVVNVALLTVVFVSVSRYAAEISYAKALSSDQANAPIDEIIIDLDKAASLNKLSDVYYRNLGNALLKKAGEILNDESPDMNVFGEVIRMSINVSQRATELSENNVVNWHLLGDVYREVAPIVQGADLFAINAYEKAVSLSPNNPKYKTALARAYLVRTDKLTQLLASEDEEVVKDAESKINESIDLAVQNLEKAIEVKADYAPAHYYLAVAYERQGNLEDAILRMEAVRSVAPRDIGVAMQLGLLYLRQGKIDYAQLELERAISIAPNFSNARWYLSYVYEQNGDLDAAIVQVEMVREINPDNPLIDQRLSDLRGGAVGVDLPAPLEEDDGEIVEDSSNL